MAATSALGSRLRQPLPHGWVALTTFALPLALLASFAVPALPDPWHVLLWILRFHIFGVTAWVTLAYLRDYRRTRPRPYYLIASTLALAVLAGLAMLVVVLVKFAVAIRSLWIPTGAGLLLWLLLVFHSARPRQRKSNRFGWLLTAALLVGLIHQAAGWSAVHHFRSQTFDFDFGNLYPLLKYNLAVRPTSTLFFYHHRMSADEGPFFPWKLIPIPPIEITYFILTQLETAALAAAVLELLLLLRRARPPRASPPALQTLVRGALGAASLGVLAGAFHAFAQVQALQDWGSTLFIEFELLLVLVLTPVAYLTPPIALLSTAALFSPLRRRLAVASLVCLLFFWGPCLLSWEVTPSLRRPGLARVSEHAAPFIAAMQSYLDETGTREAVIPESAREYFDAVPRHKFGVYPGKYFAFGPGERGVWSTWIYVPSGTKLNPEFLLYRSNHDYSQEKGTRVGDWLLRS